MIFRSAVIAMLALLVGCAAVPKRAGDSEAKKKVLNFPAAGQKVHVAANGLVRLTANYASFMSYSLKSPLSMSFGLGRVNVATSDAIWAATLQDKKVYCTLGRVYSELFFAPTKQACFIETSEGQFGKVMVAPGEYWFTKDLERPVSYSSVELPMPQTGEPYKTEVFYEGFADGKLFLTEKIYEKVLDSPSRIKPLIVTIGALPSKVMIGNLSVTVTSANQNSMSFVVD